MKTVILRFLVPISMAVAMGIAAPGGASAQACIDNSAEIQALISQGQIMSQYEAVAVAGYSVDQVLNYRLCQDGGRYYWIVGVLSADGMAQNLTVSAQ
jgi:hypothetical protein